MIRKQYVNERMLSNEDFNLTMVRQSLTSVIIFPKRFARHDPPPPFLSAEKRTVLSNLSTNR